MDMSDVAAHPIKTWPNGVEAAALIETSIIVEVVVHIFTALQAVADMAHRVTTLKVVVMAHRTVCGMHFTIQCITEAN